MHGVGIGGRRETRGRNVPELVALVALGRDDAHASRRVQRTLSSRGLRSYMSRDASSKRQATHCGQSQAVRRAEQRNAEQGPFIELDARFVERLGEEYGGGTRMRVLVRRGSQRHGGDVH